MPMEYGGIVFAGYVIAGGEDVCASCYGHKAAY